MKVKPTGSRIRLRRVGGVPGSPNESGGGKCALWSSRGDGSGEGGGEYSCESRGSWTGLELEPEAVLSTLPGGAVVAPAILSREGERLYKARYLGTNDINDHGAAGRRRELGQLLKVKGRMLHLSLPFRKVTLRSSLGGRTQ